MVPAGQWVNGGIEFIADPESPIPLCPESRRLRRRAAPSLPTGGRVGWARQLNFWGSI
jgi:hypothetical protein